MYILYDQAHYYLLSCTNSSKMIRGTISHFLRTNGFLMLMWNFFHSCYLYIFLKACMRKHIKQKKLLTNEPRSNPRLITIYHKQDTLIEKNLVQLKEHSSSSNTMIRSIVDIFKTKS